MKNNGEIYFKYDEAEKFGISRSSFRDGIDLLIERGFLQIEESGMGVHKKATRYRLIDHWRLWGTDEFKQPKRRQRQLKIGFAKGNQHGRSSRKK